MGTTRGDGRLSVWRLGRFELPLGDRPSRWSRPLGFHLGPGPPRNGAAFKFAGRTVEPCDRLTPAVQPSTTTGTLEHLEGRACWLCCAMVRSPHGGCSRWPRPRISPQMPPAGASRHEGIRSHLRLDLQQRNGSRRLPRGGVTGPCDASADVVNLPEGASSEPTLDNRCFGGRGLRRRLRAELGSTRCR
jgi:hypothetical protein